MERQQQGRGIEKKMGVGLLSWFHKQLLVSPELGYMRCVLRTVLSAVMSTTLACPTLGICHSYQFFLY